MAQNISNKIIDKTKEDDYVFAKKVRDYRKLLRFYIIPFVSVLIFVFLLIFTIIPNINYMIDGLDEAKELKVQSTQLDARITKLGKLKDDEERYLQILSKVNQIIPSEQSEVVKFRQKVAGFATDEGLEIQSLKAGENILDDNRNIEPENSNNQLIEIPSKFSFTGNFDSFRELLKKLYSGEDFFIITNMDIDVNNLNLTGLIGKVNSI
jgi:Tfp pilus assembly protein PilO